MSKKKICSQCSLPGWPSPPRRRLSTQREEPRQPLERQIIGNYIIGNKIIGNYIYISFLTDGHDPNKGDENPDDGRAPRMDVVRMRHSPVSEFCWFLFRSVFLTQYFTSWSSLALYLSTAMASRWRMDAVQQRTSLEVQKSHRNGPIIHFLVIWVRILSQTWPSLFNDRDVIFHHHHHHPYQPW